MPARSVTSAPLHASVRGVLVSVAKVREVALEFGELRLVPLAATREDGARVGSGEDLEQRLVAQLLRRERGVGSPLAERLVSALGELVEPAPAAARLLAGGQVAGLGEPCRLLVEGRVRDGPEVLDRPDERLLEVVRRRLAEQLEEGENGVGGGREAVALAFHHASCIVRRELYRARSLPGRANCREGSLT